MFLSHLCKLKIGLAILLPYLVFAVGSGFLHNHGGWDGREQAKCALAQPAQAPGADGLASTPSVSDRGHGDCPACSWAKNTLSSPDLAFNAEHATSISELIPPERFPHSTGNNRLASSRAPPFS